MRLVVFIAALFVATSAQADTYFQFDLKIGPYSVGLRVLRQYDHSRVYRTRFDLLTGRAHEGERARPVQALVWYPTKQGGAAVTYLDYLSANGSPRNLMTIEQRPATGKPPRFETLALELNRNGYEHAVPLYRKMKRLDPKFEVSERSMDDWGGALLVAGRRNEAIEIYKLVVTIYPQSPAFFDSLGEVSESGGDKKLALQYYRRALELEADNGTVARHVKRLEAAQ